MKREGKKYVDRFFQIASNLRKFLQRHAIAVFFCLNREMNLFFRKIAQLIDLFGCTCSCQLNGLSTRIKHFLLNSRKNTHAVRIVYTAFWRLIELDSGCWNPFLFLAVVSVFFHCIVCACANHEQQSKCVSNATIFILQLVCLDTSYHDLWAHSVSKWTSSFKSVGLVVIIINVCDSLACGHASFVSLLAKIVQLVLD